MDGSAKNENQRERVLNKQSANLFSTVRWIGPCGSAAAALTIFWAQRGLVNDSGLRVWLVLSLTAALSNAFAITIPSLRTWKSKRDIPVMSEAGHFAVGLTGGYLGFVDLSALAEQRSVQMALASYLFGMTLGVTLGLPSQGVITRITLVPIWFGTIASLAIAGQVVLATAIAICGVLISHGIRQDRLMWTELVELRSAAKAEADRRLTESQTDLLTGLSNRAGSDARVAELIAESSFDTTFAVLYLDLDQFKPINDLHGHASGDEVLVEIGTRIRAMCRPIDVVARIGGDEFVVILRHDSNQDTRSVDLARRVADAVSKPVQLSNGVKVSVGVSVGRAQGTARGGKLDHIVNSADSSMYALKAVASSSDLNG